MGPKRRRCQKAQQLQPNECERGNGIERTTGHGSEIDCSFEACALAFAMGLHHRLGQNSILRVLNEEIAMILFSSNFARPLRVSDKLELSGDDVALIQQWCGRKLSENQLAYLASRDGWSGAEFHRRCDSKGESVSIVFCKTGHIFGGFASVPWSCDGLEHNDSRAFLFSLCAGNGEPARPALQCKQSGFAADYAVYHGKYTFCPCFGYALALDLTCREKSRSNFNQNAIYQRPRWGKYTDETFLAGKMDNWDIEDVAIFIVHEAGESTENAAGAPADPGDVPSHTYELD